MDFLYFCHATLFLCKLHRGSVTSWIRSEQRNAAQGGVTDSWHLDGLAADITPDDPARKSFLIVDAVKLGMDAIDEGNHVHIEPSGPRRPRA